MLSPAFERGASGRSPRVGSLLDSGTVARPSDTDLTRAGSSAAISVPQRDEGIGKPRRLRLLCALTPWATQTLAAGQYPGALEPADAMTRVARFEQAGVDLFVDLTAPDFLEPYANLLTAADMNIATPAEMTVTLDIIETALAAGDTVYVHCWLGIGRRRTVAGCWLVRHGRTPDAAIDLIRE